MFERFSDEGRAAVVAAEAEAAALHHGYIGTEHLLLGVLSTGAGARLMAEFGIEANPVREDVVRIVGRGTDDIDPEALATLGIDFDAVRERVERTFGPGALSRRGCGRGLLARHIPFTARAKKALELTLREGIALGASELRAEHLVLGLLREGEGIAARILQARGLAFDEVRARIAGRDAA